jgi:hypothetical protein
MTIRKFLPLLLATTPQCHRVLILQPVDQCRPGMVAANLASLGSWPTRVSYVQQSTLTASSFQPYVDPQYQAPADLMAALQGVPPPTQYTDGGDWIMDTGASSHMVNNPGILCSSSPPPLNTSIIIGNGAPLSIHSDDTPNIYLDQGPNGCDGPRGWT